MKKPVVTVWTGKNKMTGSIKTGPQNIIILDTLRGGHLLSLTNIENTSVNAHLLNEQSCQIPSRSDLKRRSLRNFLKWVFQQQQEEEQEYKIRSDMGSVRDPKILVVAMLIVLIQSHSRSISVRPSVHRKFLRNLMCMQRSKSMS